VEDDTRGTVIVHPLNPTNPLFSRRPPGSNLWRLHGHNLHSVRVTIGRVFALLCSCHASIVVDQQGGEGEEEEGEYGDQAAEEHCSRWCWLGWREAEGRDRQEG